VLDTDVTWQQHCKDLGHVCAKGHKRLKLAVKCCSRFKATAQLIIKHRQHCATQKNVCVEAGLSWTSGSALLSLPLVVPAVCLQLTYADQFLCLCMQSLEGAVDPESPSGGYAMAQVRDCSHRSSWRAG
jgi:hypothetical protein